MTPASCSHASSSKNLPHVLVISNHWEAKRLGQIQSFAGVFIDTQIRSLRDAGIPISLFDIGTSHSPFKLINKLIQLRSKVQRVKPAIVHGQFGTIIGILSALAGPPVVITFGGHDLLSGEVVSRFRRYVGHLMSNIAALRASAIICESEELRQALWWRQARAVVIPRGVDLDLFSPGPQADARKTLNWDPARHIVLIVVRDDARTKGLELAETSITLVRLYFPDVLLQIITNVSHDRMPLCYQAADALLCTSIVEGSPNVVKEALACNLPVVSVPVGDVQERLTGVYPSSVVPRDANLIAAALMGILSTRQRSNGRDRVSNICVNGIAQRIIAVYRSALLRSS